MRHLFVGLILVSLTSAASAGGWQYGGDGGNANANASNRNYNSASAGANASAGASAYSSNSNRNSNSNRSSNMNLNSNGQGQEQGQVQGNVGLGSGNSTSVEYQGDTYEAVKQDIPAYAPDAIAAPATAPCYATWAASGGGLGLVSLGGSGYVKDHGCALGEVARIAASTGNQAIADEATALMFRLVKEEAGLVEEATSPKLTTASSPVTGGYSEDPFWFNN